MPNYLEEYLVKIGASVDGSSMRKFNQALHEAQKAVEVSSGEMAGSFLKAQSAIVGGFAAIGGAALGMIDRVAQADQEYRLFGLHMYMTKTAARELKISMDALGASLEDITWDPELRARAAQLIADQREMGKNLGFDFDKEMLKVRDIHFEFTRMGVELKYLSMKVVEDFLSALGVGPDELLKQLRRFNDWVQKDLPEISKKIVGFLMPVLTDVWSVIKATGGALAETGLAFTNLVGLLSGDTSIEGSSFSFEKMGTAIQHVVHWFAVFAEAIANVEELLAHLLSALALAASGKFSDAGKEIAAAAKDINGKTLGMVGGGIIGGLAGGPLGVLPGAFAGANVGDWIGGNSTSSPTMTSVPGVTGDSWKNLAAATNGVVSPELLAALASVESGSLGMSARSRTGAIGTMQLMPGTAKQYGVDPYDPTGNLTGGTAFLRDMMKRYGGNEAEAIGAYNAGPGRMDSFLAGKATLPSETQNEIARVLGKMGQTGSVQVGSITIKIDGTNASPHEIQHAVTSGIEDAANKRVQRNLAEFSGQAWSY